MHQAHRSKRHHGGHHSKHAAATTGGTGTTGTGTGGAAPSSGGDSIDVTDAGVTYTASVGVGSPATNYTLLIDTGSSNTWVGAATKYKPTSTSKSTGNKVNVSYGSGSFSGTECAFPFLLFHNFKTTDV
jgi:hypothetical protein